MVQEWTDGRLDDFDRKVDQRFDRVEGELKVLRFEMRSEFTAVHGEMREMRRTMMQGMLGLAAVMVTGFVAVFTAIIAQL